MAKGLCLMRNGQVLVEYGKRRVAIPPAQYKANGYSPPYDRLPPEALPKARKEPAPIETLNATSAPHAWSTISHPVQQTKPRQSLNA